MNETTVVKNSKAASSWSQTRDALGSEVGKVISRWQREYRSDGSTAAALLAKLRRTGAQAPGVSPDVWEDAGVDSALLAEQHGDDPTAVEIALHTALTLYAIHQQSVRDYNMHRAGRNFGAAVGALAFSSASPDAMRQRFVAMGAANTVAELTVHARGLITLLRDKRIGFDYGQFAADVFAWHTTGPDTVRRTWGRGYHAGLAEAKKTEAKKDDTVKSEQQGDAA